MKKMLILLLIGAAGANISAMEQTMDFEKVMQVQQSVLEKIKQFAVEYKKIEDKRYEGVVAARLKTSAERQAKLADTTLTDLDRDLLKVEDEFEVELAKLLETDHQKKLGYINHDACNIIIRILDVRLRDLQNTGAYHSPCACRHLTDEEYAQERTKHFKELNDAELAFDKKAEAAFHLYWLVKEKALQNKEQKDASYSVNPKALLQTPAENLSGVTGIVRAVAREAVGSVASTIVTESIMPAIAVIKDKIQEVKPTSVNILALGSEQLSHHVIVKKYALELRINCYVLNERERFKAAYELYLLLQEQQ